MIETDISHFTGSYSHLNLITSLSVSRPKLALAAMTAGRSSPFNVPAIGLARMFQLVSTIYSSVMVDNGRLCIKPLHYSLDASEKAVNSFVIGNAVTKLCAEKLLEVPWLAHLANYRGVVLAGQGNTAPSKRNYHSTKKTPQKPDFIGVDIYGNNHVFESKGSCSGYNKSEMQHAIDQTSQVISINGAPPTTRVVCYAEGSSSKIKAHIIDPESTESGLDVFIDRDEMIRYYYRMIGFEIWQKSKTTFVNGREYKLLPVDRYNLHFGILKDLYESFREEPSFSRVSDILSNLDVESEESIGLGIDGTILIEDASRV